MRLSKFTELMHDEFGEGYSRVILTDLVLTELGDQTAEMALAGGEEPREVWLAICRAQQVPKERWHGILKSSKPKP